jgi:hypothetical protein
MDPKDLDPEHRNEGLFQKTSKHFFYKHYEVVLLPIFYWRGCIANLVLYVLVNYSFNFSQIQNVDVLIFNPSSDISRDTIFVTLNVENLHRTRIP